MAEAKWGMVEMLAHVTWMTWQKESLPRGAINPFYREPPFNKEAARQAYREQLDGWLGVPTSWSEE